VHVTPVTPEDVREYGRGRTPSAGSSHTRHGTLAAIHWDTGSTPGRTPMAPSLDCSPHPRRKRADISPDGRRPCSSRS